MAKRVYFHKKGRMIPIQHDSLVDTADHELSPELGPYKTKRKKLWL